MGHCSWSIRIINITFFFYITASGRDKRFEYYEFVELDRQTGYS